MSPTEAACGRHVDERQVRLLISNDTVIGDALPLVYLCACDLVQIEATAGTPGIVDGGQVAADDRALLALCGQPFAPVLIGARTPAGSPGHCA